MNKIFRILCLISIIVLTAALFSCGEENAGQQSNDGRETINAEDNADIIENENAEDAKLPPPELPDLNLNGKDFVIMTHDYYIPIWSQRCIGAEELTGDSINDAVYTRNSVIEERYNCNIVERKAEDATAQIQRFVRAGDDVLDAATMHLRSLSGLITGGNLVEFSNLPYINLANPWWDQNCIKDLSIAGKIFAVASDMTLMDKDATSAMVFNKRLQADYQIDDLYQLVKDGKWTLDKMLELCKVVSVDVDGNGIMDDNDAYGLLYQRDTMSSFLSGSGEFIGGKDENDLPVLTLNTPKAIEVLNKLYDILYDEMYCFHVMKFFDSTGKGFTEGMNEIFQDNRALLMWIRMADVENLRNMDTDFGILPIPKYDERQEKYLQTVNPYVGVAAGVPRSAGSLDNSSIILEAMSYESKYILQPAYYDVVLHTKITRDDESSAMLDIIFGSRAYDIGDVFDFNGLGSDVIYMTMTFNRNIVSTIERKEERAIIAIERLIASIQDLD